MLVDAAEIAARFGVDRSTIARWKRRYGITVAQDSPQRNHAQLYDWDAVLARVPHSRVGGRLLNPTETARLQRLKDIALDLEDLAHQTRRGDVDQATWERVCSARLVDTDTLSAMHYWRQTLTKMRIPFQVVGEWGEPYVATNEGRPSLMRFDWPAVLRWTRRVLG